MTKLFCFHYHEGNCEPAILGTTYVENHCIKVVKIYIKHRQGVVTYQIPFKR